MGIIEFISNNQLLLSSHIITYGNEANPELTERIRAEIENMWNEPNGLIRYNGNDYNLRFSITAAYKPQITEEEILTNDDPLNNYFRIEAFAAGNISYVDGLGSNTGYFKLENLYEGSTTAAHEYGHTLGLPHPEDTNLLGKGVPGIMYPRGTLVDPQYQYDPTKPPGVTGGTMHPMFRKVKPEDIALLKIHTLDFKNNRAVIGDFSSVWHPDEGDVRE